MTIEDLQFFWNDGIGNNRILSPGKEAEWLSLIELYLSSVTDPSPKGELYQVKICLFLIKFMRRVLLLNL